MSTPAELLEQAVRALTDEQRANLRYHLAVGTEILCGPRGWLWEGDGGGSPWALAASRSVGARRVDVYAEVADIYGPSLDPFDRMRRSVAGAPVSLLGVMDQLTEDEARAAIGRGVSA